MNKLIYIMIIAGGLQACSSPATEEQAAETTTEITISREKQKAMGIITEAAQWRELPATFQANGKVIILSQYQESVSGKITGNIDKILVLEGQRISKGQALMEISSSEYIQLQENYLSAKAELNFLKNDYERQQQLKQANITAGKEYQQAEAKYLGCLTRLKAAEARLKFLGINPQQLKLNDATSLSPNYIVRSGLDGYLLKLPANVGMSVAPGVELAHIVNVDHYHADIFVYEKDIHKVHEGQDVQLTFTNSSIPPQKGRVEFITRGIDPATRTIIVHVVFLHPHKSILPDMTVKARFESKGTSAMSIPAESILTEGDVSYVYYCSPQQPQQFRKARITLQHSTEDYVAFTPADSIPAGALFVSKGALLLENEATKEAEE
jgi:cobalt-zinc-cadmium efflux system membrane fusion protein